MRAILLLATLVMSTAAQAQRSYGDPYSGAMQTVSMYVQQNNSAAFRNDYRSPAFQVERQIWQPSFFSLSSGSSSAERTAEDRMLEARGLASYNPVYLVPFGARDGWRPPATNAADDIWAQYQAAGANVASVVASAESKANAGDITGMLVMALAHLQGRGVPANQSRALDWLRRAADAGEPHAALYYARGLLGSEDAGADYATALRYFRKAEAAMPEAAMEVGLILAEGRPGVPADPAAGAAAFERAANTGNAMAQYIYAVSLQTGTGTARDPAAAVAWLQKASDQGLPMAKLRLGQAYYFGSGIAADYRRALPLLEQAAGAGELGAFNALGLYYSDGLAVAEDAARATGYFRRGAEMGDPRAQSNLGLAYMGGMGAVAEDHREAARWLAPAAVAGIPEAEFALGLMTLMGAGVPADDARGLQLVRQAAARNFPMAYGTLCTLTLREQAGMRMDAAEFTPTLMTGIGLNEPACLYVQAGRLSRGILNPRDQQQAMDFLKRAAEGGYGPAELDYAQGFLGLIGQVDPSYDEGLAAEGRRWLTRAAEHGNQEAERILRERGWR